MTSLGTAEAGETEEVMTPEERAEATRDEVARILEIVARDGLDEPRDLDAAIDAIDEAYKAAISAEREAAIEGCAAVADARAKVCNDARNKYASGEIQDHRTHDQGRIERNCSLEASHIAASIRALKGGA